MLRHSLLFPCNNIFRESSLFVLTQMFHSANGCIVFHCVDELEYTELVLCWWTRRQPNVPTQQEVCQRGDSVLSLCENVLETELCAFLW